MPASGWFRPAYGGPPPLSPISPVGRGMRNGVEPSASRIREVVGRANELAVKLGRNVFSASVSPLESASPATTEETFRFVFFSGATANVLRILMGFWPAGTTDPTDQPEAYWSLDGTPLDPVPADNRSSDAIVLGEPHLIPYDIDITPETVHTLVLTQSQHARVASIAAWELPRRFVDPADGLTVDVAPIAHGSPILGSTQQGLQAMIRRLARRQGQVFVAYSVPTSTARTTTSASYVNAFDAAVTAYSASAPGHWTWPRYQGWRARAGYLQVRVWARMKATAGTAYLKLVDSSGDIAELSTASTSETTAVTTAEWNTGNPANGLKVDPLIKCSGGGTAHVWAWGMYLYWAA